MDTTPFRILIIDDNPAIHQDFIKILSVSQHAVILEKFDTELFSEQKNPEQTVLPEFHIDSASQGLEGIKMVKKAVEEKNPYALAFVDVRMPPGMDGVETIKRIWSIDPEVQVVICSAYSDYSWEETISALGINDNVLILKKPFDIISVQQIATALTQKWILRRETEKHTAYLNKLVEARTESLQQSYYLLRATIESASDGILVVDLQGNIVDFNHQFTKFWNIPQRIIESKCEQNISTCILESLIEPENHKMHLAHSRAHPSEDFLSVYHLKNTKIVECCSKPHRIGSEIVGRVYSFRDISEQTKLREKLEYQAHHDALTGLPNRLLLMKRMEQIIRHPSPDNKKTAILFFDLDRFKMINDSMSHVVGDELLCAVADRLKRVVREGDLLVRLGGDEFVMICESFRRLNQVSRLAQKILHCFDEPFHIAGRQLIISSSIGISIYPEDGNTPDSLLSNADMAMYQAKFLGGNRFALYNDALNAQTSREFELQLALQQAINNGEFFLVYQPQFSIGNRKVQAMEVLLRWQHPQKGIILPKEFIATAEKTGLIVPIGEWVLRETCKQIAHWRHKGLDSICVAWNVADKQLRQPGFSELIKGLLEEFSLPSACLEVEVTENVILDKAIQDTVREIKALGIRIILDDFGTGNSSLNLLKELSVDSLKIDQSFIQNIHTSPSDEAIIDAIIAIARSMRFHIIAEGVETPSQLAFLEKRRCNEVQGHLMSAPLSADEMERLLKKHR